MDGADTVILPQMRLAFKTFIVTELPQLLRDAGNKDTISLVMVKGGW